MSANHRDLTISKVQKQSDSKPAGKCQADQKQVLDCESQVSRGSIQRAAAGNPDRFVAHFGGAGEFEIRINVGNH